MDLKATWTGKAMFLSAFARVLPMARSPATPRPLRRARPPATPRVRSGRTVHYTAGPARHRPGKKGENWTNYMVRTILEHTDTESAISAHYASGHYQGKKLDFTWMFKNAYITKTEP